MPAVANPDLDLQLDRPYLYPKQLAAVYDEHRYSLIEASAQPLDSIIQTPGGPRQFGSLKVGDAVFSVDGTVTEVTGVFPKGIQPTYLMTFTDGATTRASGDHLWKANHSRDGWRTVTTDQLRGMTSGSCRHFRFPIAAAVDYPRQQVRIDPWLLGVLIGDGSLCGNALSFSTADPEIVERVKRAVPAGYEVRAGGEYSWRIVARSRGAGYEYPSIRFKAGGHEVSVARKYVGRSSTVEGALEIHKEAMIRRYGSDVPAVNLRQELRSLGLLGLQHDQKFIPDLYLRNAIDVRLEILRGVMDTDGSKGRGRGAILEQTSERLAYNVQEIVRSLGGLCLITPAEPRRLGWKKSYRANIRHDDVASFFWLPRKKTRRPTSGSIVRTLTKIERIDDCEVQCISVAHPSRLYVTDNFIVTHNTKAGKTSACISWILEKALSARDGQNFWWVAPISDQALIAFRRAMRAIPQDLFTPNISLKTITLVNGSVIWFKSGDKPNSLYGEDVYGVVVDEASRMKEDAYIAIRSTLTYTRAPIRIIGNVRGRKNWFFRLARRAEQGDPEMGYHKIIAQDAVDAGVLDAKEIDDARTQMPEQSWRELYLAEPSDDGGNPFGLQHIAICTLADLQPGPPVVWGWDLAKKQDWAVGIGLNLAGNVCRFERFQHIPWDEIIERIKKATGSVPALVDSTGVGDPILDILQKLPGTRFEGYHFTQASKQKLMEGLSVAIQGHKVGFPDGPIPLELAQFEFEYSRTGVRYSAPQGFHDDCVCALALAVMHKLHSPPPMTITQDTLVAIARSGIGSRHRRMR